jgi:hypothetical protein
MARAREPPLGDDAGRGRGHQQGGRRRGERQAAEQEADGGDAALGDGEHSADQLLRADRGRLLGQPDLVVEAGVFQLGEVVDRRHGAEELLLGAQADPAGQLLSRVGAEVLQQRPQRGDADDRDR